MPLNRRDFLTALSTLTGVAVLPASAATSAAGSATFHQVFAHPPAQARPWIRWWWPGGVVDDAELRREIKVLRENGFGGAEIQAFNPGIPNLTKVERESLHDYANPAYFAHLNTCADEARTQGMQIDATFGSAWPSGGGFAITPELALLELTPALTSISAPLTGPLKLNVPVNTRKFGAMGSLDARNKDPRAADWRQRMAAREKLVAVVAFRGQAPLLDKNKNYRTAVVKASGSIDIASSLNLTDKLGPDGVLDWTPPADGPWQIVVFKQFVMDNGVLAGVGEGPQLVLDHFKRAAFDAHARRVGEPMARGGAAPPGLHGTFIDSLELMQDMYWSEELLEEFSKRRGYDLLPHLPHLLQPGWMEAWNQHNSPPYFDAGDIGERIRADYRLTLSELLIDHFWRPFAEWNRRRGLVARVQAHGGPSDVLQSYGLADIPETEDLESGGDTHFMRLARAAANLYGKKLVSCESLCWPKKSFEPTPEQWLVRVNRLFASGVTRIVMHGFPYALHRDAWPGWYPFAPSGFLAGFSSLINEANPLWAAIGKLNGYIARTQAIMQSGASVVPVAVYLAEIGYYHTIESKETHALLDSLLGNGYDYDRINDDCLIKGRVARGELVAPGGARYRALVVPQRSGMRAATAQQLARLAKAGLTIVYVGRPPSRDEGYLDYERRDRQVRDAVQATLDSGARIAAPDTLPSVLRQARVPANLMFTSDPCMFVEKKLGGRSAYFLHNPKDNPVKVRFTTGAAGHPERWDGFDGSSESLDVTRTGKLTEVAVDIGAGGAALIVFGARRPALAPAWTMVDALDLNGHSWTLQAAGHGHKGRKIRHELTISQLVDWRSIEGLSDLSGEVTYIVNVDLPAHWLRDGCHVCIELGTVHDMATISANGKPVTTLITRAFDADLTGALRSGANRLTVKVANSPTNAMINPKLPGLKDLKQQPAGLLGPVRLVLKQRKASS